MLLAEVKERYSTRFDELIAEGEFILVSIEDAASPGKFGNNPDEGFRTFATKQETLRRFEQWKTNCFSFLHHITMKKGPLAERVLFFNQAQANRRHIGLCLVTLKALKEIYALGLLDDTPASNDN